MSLPVTSPKTFHIKGDRSAAFTVISPGRVNLIGEHTDYNNGLVLPMAIEPHVRIQISPRNDHWMLLSTQREGDASARFDLSRTITSSDCAGSWSAYPCGVVAGLQKMGWKIPGFEAEISASLPSGVGLSSSAALEVGIATAIEALCQKSLTLEEKALLAQKAEHEFTGVPCGIMDQFAVTFGQAGSAMLLDCRTRTIRYVNVDNDSVSILVINSGIKHSLADGEYAKRRRECDSATRILGVNSLRDVDLNLWESRKLNLPDLERKRARHVVTEHERTIRFVIALESGDFEVAGEEMYGSHRSLSSDYEVSCTELDLLVGLSRKIDGVFGCRMTGGGFGGCVVALIETQKAAAIQKAFQTGYEDAAGIKPAMFVTKAAKGAALLE